MQEPPVRFAVLSCVQIISWDLTNGFLTFSWFLNVDGHFPFLSEVFPNRLTGSSPWPSPWASRAPIRADWLALPCTPTYPWLPVTQAWTGQSVGRPQQLSFSPAARDPLVPMLLPLPPSRVTALKPVLAGLVSAITPPGGLRR